MCAGYGLELAGPTSSRSTRFGLSPDVTSAVATAHVTPHRTPGPIPPGDTAAGRALLKAWVAEQGGRARITGRNAHNLNPIIRVREHDRELGLGWWWLHVGGAPAKFSAFNARADRLVHSWLAPFQQRALLPATWYIEKGVRFALPEGEEFGMAAVTAPAATAALESYALVTREAVGVAAATHDRMPLVVPRELHDEWLDPRRSGDAELVRAVLAASERISREVVATGRERDAAAPVRGAERAARVSPAGAVDEQPRLF